MPWPNCLIGEQNIQSGTAFVQQQHLENMAYSTTKRFFLLITA